MKIPKNKILSVQHKKNSITVFFCKNLESLCYVILKVKCKGLHFNGDDVILIDADVPVESDKDEAMFWHEK